MPDATHDDFLVGAPRPFRGAASSPAPATIPSLPVGTVLSLIGGLALLAAFTMPWLGIQVGAQGALLSGDVLGRLLGSTTDLRQFIPGSSGNPLEAQALRALIYLFPTSGGIAALLALLEGWLGRRGWLTTLIVVSGVVPLIGLLGGLGFLPPTASRQHGLWVIGLGSAAVMLGPLLNGLLSRRAAASSS
ncbi:MAG: hypothetical protein IT306_03265 [Chloroflexi bacterium]|nr:hypothetical protein [Chloroflexota bacterium]